MTECDSKILAKIAIPLGTAIFSILMVLILTGFFEPLHPDSPASIKGILLLGIVAYHLIIATIIYAIAAFIKFITNVIIRAGFFIVLIVITSLPFISAVYTMLFFRFLVEKHGYHGVFIFHTLSFMAAAMVNSPVLFAYAAHKIISWLKIRKLKSEDEL